MEGGNVSLPNF